MRVIDKDNHVGNKIEDPNKRSEIKVIEQKFFKPEQNLSKLRKQRIVYEMNYTIETRAMLIK